MITVSNKINSELASPAYNLSSYNYGSYRLPFINRIGSRCATLVNREGFVMFKGILFLLKYSWKFKKSYVVYIFLSQIVNAVMPLASIILPKYIIDELAGQKRIDWLLIYTGVLLGTIFIGSLLSNFLRCRAFIKKNDVFNEFQIFLGNQIMNVDFEKLEDPQFLDLKEKAYKFLYADGQGFGVVLEQAVGIIGQVFTFIGIIAVISTLNFWMVLIFIVLVLLTSLVNSRIKKANIELDLQKTPHERRNSYYLNLFSDFTYGKEIRIGNLRDWLIGKYRYQLSELKAFYKKNVRNNEISMNFGAVVSFVQQAVAYLYLIFQVVRGLITLGDFTMYLNAINSFTSSMRSVMDSVIAIQRYSIYFTAVEEFLSLTNNMQKLEGLPVASNAYRIEFDHVSFRYPGQENYALRDISIVISPEEKLSIVGENGAGKTTFIKLLTRLYNPTEGRILLNGIDLQEYNYVDYMNILSAVFQDYKLFSFTLRENIALRDTSEYEASLIEDTAVKAGLSDKLSKLEKGIETAIYKNFDETGFEPSGGEGQKIALARAMYKNTPIVILDEPTAALDPRAEYEIYRSFNDLVYGKTALYVSHRLSSARFCDKIAVFHHGEIAEYGTHAELIAKKGLYSELFHMQAQFYVDE